ncbi:hypothetical protein NM688_g3825 [Phlebia brevispora]|uniref:Uncharacterized protein n=1 Tax=Phlebia brevispora TaxID=194682 RepID=A0ACC1T503_9APHY|nr:hypothetical protein NM688_g3825 [Phlebia brevispora]
MPLFSQTRFQLLLLLTGGLACSATFPSPLPLRGRQQLVIPGNVPKECENACSTLIQAINQCTTDACLCTNKVDVGVKTCYDCLLDANPDPSLVTQGQDILNELEESCEAEGFKLTPLTLCLSTASPPPPPSKSNSIIHSSKASSSSSCLTSTKTKTLALSSAKSTSCTTNSTTLPHSSTSNSTASSPTSSPVSSIASSSSGAANSAATPGPSSGSLISSSSVPLTPSTTASVLAASVLPSVAAASPVSPGNVGWLAWVGTAVLFVL